MIASAVENRFFLPFTAASGRPSWGECFTSFLPLLLLLEGLLGRKASQASCLYCCFWKPFLGGKLHKHLAFTAASGRPSWEESFTSFLPLLLFLEALLGRKASQASFLYCCFWKAFLGGKLHKHLAFTAVSGSPSWEESFTSFFPLLLFLEDLLGRNASQVSCLYCCFWKAFLGGKLHKHLSFTAVSGRPSWEESFTSILPLLLFLEALLGRKASQASFLYCCFWTPFLGGKLHKHLAFTVASGSPSWEESFTSIYAYLESL